MSNNNFNETKVKRDRAGRFTDKNTTRIPHTSTGTTANGYTRAERDVEAIYQRDQPPTRHDIQTIGDTTCDIIRHQKENDHNHTLNWYRKPGTKTNMAAQTEPLTDHEFAALMLNRSEHRQLAARPDLTPEQAGRLAKELDNDYQPFAKTQPGVHDYLLQNRHLTEQAWNAIETNMPDAWEYQEAMLANPTYPHRQQIAEKWLRTPTPEPKANRTENGAYTRDPENYITAGEWLEHNKNLTPQAQEQVSRKLAHIEQHD